ncbi:MAG: response regulator [Nitrospirae bacterium]|nr:response regulator [Nitrospirota bacterium]
MQTKVLIVDDEMEFASTLAERLQIRGYNAKSVYCAEDAIALSRNDPPDVMLLDLRMPGMNGIHVLKTIKQFNPSIQVIMLTGLGASQESAEGMEIGAFDCIMKPVDIEKLVVMIDEAKNKKSEKGV